MPRERNPVELAAPLSGGQGGNRRPATVVIVDTDAEGRLSVDKSLAKAVGAPLLGLVLARGPGAGDAATAVTRLLVALGVRKDLEVGDRVEGGR